MGRKLSKEQKEYFIFIGDYEFINYEGRLDLERFCVYLSACFNCDNILEISPEPRLIYNLLIELMSKEYNQNELKNWIQYQNISDWKPEHASIYPDKYRTLIHIAGLLKVNHNWIYEIGHYLMKIPDDSIDRKYYAWVKEEWQFVYKFINSYHNYFHKFLKEFDYNTMKKRGYSLFEALHSSYSNNIDYDKAIDNIKLRNKVYTDVLFKIENAINDNYFLEAITLEENLISNCFYNYLVAKKVKDIDTSFFNLLSIFKKNKYIKSMQVSLFVDDLDKWRKDRNTSIHGFIKSRTDTLKESNNEFMFFSKETAEIGYKLSQKVVSWYNEESINFIKTDWSS